MAGWLRVKTPCKVLTHAFYCRDARGFSPIWIMMKDGSAPSEKGSLSRVVEIVSTLRAELSASAASFRDGLWVASNHTRIPKKESDWPTGTKLGKFNFGIWGDGGCGSHLAVLKIASSCNRKSIGSGASCTY